MVTRKNTSSTLLCRYTSTRRVATIVNYYDRLHIYQIFNGDIVHNEHIVDCDLLHIMNAFSTFVIFNDLKILFTYPCYMASKCFRLKPKNIKLELSMAFIIKL
jgi:hypothetical protein